MRTPTIKGVLDETIQELVVKSTRQGCEYLLDNNDESIKKLFEKVAYSMPHWGNNVGYRADNIEEVEQISKLFLMRSYLCRQKDLETKKSIRIEFISVENH